MPAITDIRQVEALVSATRQEIVDGLQTAGPASIRELGEMLGRAPDSLYYHFRVLEKVGLILQVETRPSSRRDEVVYDLAQRPAKIELDPQDTRSRSAMNKIYGTFLRLAERNLKSAMETGTARLQGPDRNASAGHLTAWLTDDEVRAVNQKLQELQQIFHKKRVPGSGKLHALTYALSPVTPTERDRTRKPHAEESSPTNRKSEPPAIQAPPASLNNLESS